jgi:hypothetical protein
MNSITLPETDSTNFPKHASGHDSRVLIEEIACAIANAQAALFAGRIQDFECCVMRQQELCVALKALLVDKPDFISADSRELVAAARRVKQQNLIFGAIMRRTRRHLESLRSLLNGLSPTYQPKPVKAPGREV